MEYFSSKELYMRNGGNKSYIFRDGHMDQYTATADEEAQWREELIANYLEQLKTEMDSFQLLSKIETLHSFHIDDLEKILVDTIKLAPANGQNAIAFCLWRYYKYEKSLSIIKANIFADTACQDIALHLLSQMFGNRHASEILIDCLDGKNFTLKAKAKKYMWGILFRSGITRLRETEMLTQLNALDSNTDAYKELVLEMKLIVRSPPLEQ